MRIARASIGCGVLLLAVVSGSLIGCQTTDATRQVERVEDLRAGRRLPAPDQRPAGERLARDLPDSDGLRLDQIQLVATHNSYHLRSSSFNLWLIGIVEPEWPAKLKYEHAALYEQFDAGIRSIELDVRNLGSRFAVSHVPGVDSRSTSPDFRLALEEIRLWSEANPAHVPIIVIMELKNDWGSLDWRQKDFDRAALDRLDAEIRSAFPAAGLLVPDDVRAGARSLEEAILSRGWPLLRDIRGKVIFVLHEDEAYRKIFVEGNATLAGRAMFTCAPTGAPDAAIRILNDPVGDGEKIRGLVQLHYLVRTRADADLATNPALLAAAIASGAQIISTDFPPYAPQAVTGYFAAFSGGTTIRESPADR